MKLGSAILLMGLLLIACFSLYTSKFPLRMGSLLPCFFPKFWRRNLHVAYSFNILSVSDSEVNVRTSCWAVVSAV